MSLFDLSSFKSDFKSTLKLAWPMIVSQLSYMIMGAIDNVMIAKLGVDELATAAFCNNIFAILIVTQMGLASAVSPLIGNALGSGDKAKVGKLYRHALILLVGFSLVMCLIMYVLGVNVHWFKQEAVVNEKLWTYYPWLLSTLPLIAIHQAHKQFYDGIEESKTPMKYLYMSIPINIFLNWIFIYGNWGAPALGLHGAGLATLVSRVIVLALMVYRTHALKIYEELYQISFKKFKFESDIWKNILVLGVPSSFQYLFEVGAFAAAGITAGQIGKLEIAAHQIALNIASFPFMVALGWSFAVSIKIGNALGEGSIERCRRLGINSTIAVALYMCVTASLLILGKNLYPSIYLNDPEVLALASGIMVIAAAFQFGDGIQAVAIGMLRGFQDMKIPTLITLVAYWLFAIPVGRYLAFNTDLKLYGIWLALAAGLYLSAGLLLTRFWLITNPRKTSNA